MSEESFKTDEERLALRICKNCHVSLMNPLEEAHDFKSFFKCPTCGFTVQIKF